MPSISWDDFTRIELRVGSVLAVDEFPEARKPAYRITVDFGADVGVRRTSAQVTALYSRDELVGRQIVGVVNFPPKQIGPFMSEFLLTGFADERGDIVVATPERPVPNGARLV